MASLRALGIACLVACLVACAGAGAAKAPTAPSAGRVGVHGMVVFGGGEHVFVSHIPMFRPPHDMQVIAEVAWTGGPRSFSDRLYTFEPRPFSLDAFVRGEVVDVDGTLFEGNFESGGRPLGPAHARVVRIVHARTLDPSARPGRAEPKYMTIGEGDDAALVRVIDGPPGVDEILRARDRGVLSCLVGPEFEEPCPAQRRE
jgi:hypothetical protein